MKKAVVLLSGGLDSATILFEAKKKKFRPYCLIFNYGQRHKKEIRQAKKIAEAAGADYSIVNFRMPWKGSSLLDKSMKLPMRRVIDAGTIPSTYVPGRNIIFLSFAASFAEAIGARAIFIGANAIDYSGYPDCRPEFFETYQKMVDKGLKTGVQGKTIRIYTPLINKTKAQIIRRGVKLKVPYGLTWSCYAGSGWPCGRCDSCLLRAKGFADAGLKDPAVKREQGNSRRM
jgi:7-cyano-7-deazaguanine synthase